MICDVFSPVDLVSITPCSRLVHVLVVSNGSRCVGKVGFHLKACRSPVRELPLPAAPQCYKLIYAYMGFAVFDMFFVLTGAVVLRVFQVRVCCSTRCVCCIAHLLAMSVRRIRPHRRGRAARAPGAPLGAVAAVYRRHPRVASAPAAARPRPRAACMALPRRGRALAHRAPKPRGAATPTHIYAAPCLPMPLCPPQVLGLHIDAFSLCYILFNFSVRTFRSLIASLTNRRTPLAASACGAMGDPSALRAQIPCSVADAVADTWGRL